MTSTLEFGAESVADNRTIVKPLSSGKARGAAAFSPSFQFLPFLFAPSLLFLLYVDSFFSFFFFFFLTFSNFPIIFPIFQILTIL